MHTLLHSVRDKTAVRVGLVISPACFPFDWGKLHCRATLNTHLRVSMPCGSVLSVHSALGLICILLCVNKRHLFWGQSLPAAIQNQSLLEPCCSSENASTCSTRAAAHTRSHSPHTHARAHTDSKMHGSQCLSHNLFINKWKHTNSDVQKDTDEGHLQSSSRD